MRLAALCSVSVALCLLPTLASAHGGCDFRTDRTAAVDTAGVEKIVIRVGAGDLVVKGGAAARIEARGEACASTQALLDATNVVVRREGATAYVESVIPVGELERQRGDAHASIDLRVAVPSNLPVEAQDSSGDAHLTNIASLVIADSSGDLEISEVKGAVSVQDSSGEIRISNVGSVRLEDSSGDARIERVTGQVEIVADSSGALVIRDVGGRVHVARDSSGDIRVDDVRGSVTVGMHSSGGIYARNVAGDFTVESKGSGEIEHDNVRGRVSLPEDR